jgi:hypothetical protein
MPPPEPGVVLPVKVLPVTVSGAVWFSLNMPPPLSEAVLPLKVLLLTVSEPLALAL